MKKIRYILIMLIILFPLNVSALSKEEVKYSKCVDGDTIKVIYNNKEVTVRFLAVDTPETKHPKKGEEPYGKEASNYTCNKIKNAKKIELEFDDNSDKTDKYDRYLAWVFVDDSLLQAELIKNGLAEVAYLYGDYKYTGLLQDYEENAKLNKVGKYSDIDTSSYSKKKKEENKNKKILGHTTKYYVKKFINKIIDELFK